MTTDTSPPARGLRAIAAAQGTLPATRRADLDEGTVEYLLAGEGAPVVVLLNGLGVPLQGWALVVAELARDTTVFAHNRLGLGASSAPRRPQTGTAIVDVLRATLAAAAVEPPFVVVGHALGGLYANLYARLYPQEIAGVVLLEATHPDDDLLERHFRFLPRALTRALIATSVTEQGRNAEQRHLAQTTREIAAAGPFPPCRWPSSAAPRRRRSGRWRRSASRPTPPASGSSSRCRRSAGRSSRPPAGISRRHRFPTSWCRPSARHAPPERSDCRPNDRDHGAALDVIP